MYPSVGTGPDDPDAPTQPGRKDKKKRDMTTATAVGVDWQQPGGSTVVFPARASTLTLSPNQRGRVQAAYEHLRDLDGIATTLM